MTDPRATLDRVLTAALASVDPGRLIAERLDYDGRHLAAEAGGQRWRGDLDAFRRVLVLGAGKAAARMAQAIEDKLGERVSGGLVVVKHGHHLPLRRIAVAEAGHPTPDAAGIAAARRLAALADQAGADTLVILLLSGGGSALLCAPQEESGLTLADKQAVTAALLASGADIAAINCVRKHLSALKGGRLLARLAPARCLALILSDVIGDRLDVIASGPVSPDPTSYADALAVLDAHDLRHRIPATARLLLEQGAAGARPETLKPDDPRLTLVTPLVLGNTLTAVRAAQTTGTALGLPTLSLTAALCGEAREAGRQLYAIARDLRDHALLTAPPALLISGGETTVTLGANPGLGGRNQELALSFLCALTRDPAQGAGLHLLAAASDGGDGPTDAAGAYASATVLTRARTLGLSPEDALARHDSYHLFAATGDLLHLGPTLTNVCDLQLLLVTPSL